jgi:hypothetical protein
MNQNGKEQKFVQAELCPTERCAGEIRKGFQTDLTSEKSLHSSLLSSVDFRSPTAVDATWFCQCIPSYTFEDQPGYLLIQTR